MRKFLFFALSFSFLSGVTADSSSIKIELHDIKSESRGSTVPLSVILPPGYSNESKDLPLLINLHGGGGSRNNLIQQAQIAVCVFAHGIKGSDFWWGTCETRRKN